jgi:hypothetical protein
MIRLRGWLIAWESKAQQRALDRQSPKWWEPRQLLLGTEDPSLHVRVAQRTPSPSRIRISVKATNSHGGR